MKRQPKRRGKGSNLVHGERIQVCVRCKRESFIVQRRDVSAWPLIEDRDASEHCARCWFKMALNDGWIMGTTSAARGLPETVARIRAIWDVERTRSASAAVAAPVSGGLPDT